MASEVAVDQDEDIQINPQPKTGAGTSKKGSSWLDSTFNWFESVAAWVMSWRPSSIREASASTRALLLLLMLGLYGAAYWLLFSTVLVVPQTRMQEFIQLARPTMFGFVEPPASLSELVSSFASFLSWVVWFALFVSGVILMARERLANDDDGDVRVVLSGLAILWVLFAFGTQVHDILGSVFAFLGIEWSVTLDSFRYVVAALVAGAALWKSVEGERDWTALYGCLMLEGMIFRMYNPSDIASLSFLVIALLIALYELTREGSRLGIISKAVGTVVVFAITYAMIYDLVAYVSMWLTGPVLGSTGNFLVYNVEVIAVAVSFLFSRAYANRAIRLVAWCGNGKVRLLDKLATSECVQKHEGDYLLTMILVAALAMVVVDMIR